MPDLLVLSGFSDMYPWILLGITGLLIFGNLLTGPFQHWFIFRPRTLPPDYTLELPHPYQEHWLDATHRGRIHLLWFQNPDPPKGLVLYFHGNASTVDSWNPTLAFLQKQDYQLITFDYRGFGKSTGPRSQENLYRDAEAVYQWVRQRSPDVPLILYGRSMGSAFATRVAAHFSAEYLILETPFSGMKRLFYSYYPFLPKLFLFKYTFPTYWYLQLVNIPVLVLQGTSDRIVPFRNAMQLTRYLKPSDRFVRIDGGGHRNLATFSTYRQEVGKVLKNVSKPDTSSRD